MSLELIFITAVSLLLAAAAALVFVGLVSHYNRFESNVNEVIRRVK